VLTLLNPFDNDNSAVTHEVVRDMISRYGDRFAVDVGGPDEPPNGDAWDKSVIRRLAWRRWPARGAPGLQAAKAAHERARAWAVDDGHGESDVGEGDGCGDDDGEGDDVQG